MEPFADYTFYKDEYGGTKVSEADFTALAKRASREVQNGTNRRAQRWLDKNKGVDEIRFCTCAIIDFMHAADEKDAELGVNPVQSESNDGFSVTYANAETTSSTTGMAAYNSGISNLIVRNLASTGILFGGVPVAY